jgi:glycosyltransferase involved in cell wall biosynthesis
MTEKIRIAYVGDNPFINSGFGVVARSIMSRWPIGEEEEFEVHVLGTMYGVVPKDISPYSSFMPACSHDSMGIEQMLDFIKDVNPDVMFMIGDPGTLRSRLDKLIPMNRIATTPSVTYFPVENTPMSPHIIKQARMAFCPVTYTRWGQEAFRSRGITVDYAYHGVDHADFRQYHINDRRRLKTLVGWKDKFVVGLIGVNKRTNRQPTMIEAARILKDRGRDDIIIYLHCQSVGDRIMAGWELNWMLEEYDVHDMVILKPNQKEHPYIARPIDKISWHELLTPITDTEAITNLATLDFISTINTFDLYLDPASAHGWNLPASEAARCGVPVATVDDDFARKEIFGDCAHMMKPTGWDHWHTGAQLPLVSPKQIADTIELFADDSSYRTSVARKCKAKFDSLEWQPIADSFAEKIRIAHGFGKEIVKQLAEQPISS